MAKDKGFAAERLLSFIQRIERLIEEKKTIQADIKEVYAEAKSTGFDIKIMKRCIAERAMETSDRTEYYALLDTYLNALGMQLDLDLIAHSADKEDGGSQEEEAA